MSPEYATPAAAARLRQHLIAFVAPLLRTLDPPLDIRLVRTFLATLQAILVWRHRPHALLLSELGAFVLSPARAPAGTKRLDRLLRAPWSSSRISAWLWHQAVAHVQDLRAQQHDPLLLWDESVLEKPETLHSADLCAVRSSKGRPRTRTRTGFVRPPTSRPLWVPGLHWLGLVVLGHRGPPVVAAMHWWTTRGPHASTATAERLALLTHCHRQWGRQVRHVWDRGFASAAWLSVVLDANLRFVLRWKKRSRLLDQDAELRKTWEIVRGKRTWERRWVRERHSGAQYEVGVLAVSVCPPQHARPLWLVVARSGRHREPWYLLTSDPIRSAADAWAVVVAYARRWQIEVTWRYGKSELGMESPRVWSWERRCKLLLLTTLVYAFLLSLLTPGLVEVRAGLVRAWCHRTGQRHRTRAMPLYRLRTALRRLWLAYPPLPPPPLLNPG